MIRKQKKIVFILCIIGLFIGTSIVPAMSIVQRNRLIGLNESFVGLVRERKTSLLDEMIDYLSHNETFFNEYVDKWHFERIEEVKEYDRMKKRYDRLLSFSSDYKKYDGRYYDKMMDFYDEETRSPPKLSTSEQNFDSGKTWFVDVDGKADFIKIQDAIDNASNGDTIYVYSGFYQENLLVDKSVILQGSDRETTIIDGDGSRVVSVSVSWVNINGFTIQNGQYGIWLSSSSDSIITNNTFHSNGITITGNSLKYWNRHTIENNSVNDRPIRYYKNAKDIIVPSDTAQVILANCTNVSIHNLELSTVDTAIQLGFSYHNTIIDNQIYNNRQGIELVNSSFNTITNNHIANNKKNGLDIHTRSNTNYIINNIINSNKCDGINVYRHSNNNHIIQNDIGNNSLIGVDIYDSANNTFIDKNHIYDNKYVGLYLRFTTYASIIDNVFVSNGIGVRGNTLGQWNTHTIFNNFRNGKIIQYYKNLEHIVVPQNSAQVILANCSFFSIENLSISDTDIALQLGYSSNNSIRNNTLSYNNYNGMYLHRFSENNTIKKNIITNNKYDGIELFESSNNIIADNIIIENNWDGLCIYQSINTEIKNNTFRRNGFQGIHLIESFDNLIKENNISKNNRDGISLTYSSRNIVNNNMINSNTDCGIEIYYSLNNYIYHNNVSNNNEYGFLLIQSSGNTFFQNDVLSNIYGILSYFSSDNLLINNSIDENKYGIQLWHSNNHTIVGNSFSHNIRGINLRNSYLNAIKKCTISNSEWCAIYSYESKFNSFSHNDFIDNYDHYMGWQGDTNFFLRNYWSGRIVQLPIPYLIQINRKIFDSPSPHVRFTFNWDWFPKVIPYNYNYDS